MEEAIEDDIYNYEECAIDWASRIWMEIELENY
jgi:hypothetical protein